MHKLAVVFLEILHTSSSWSTKVMGECSISYQMVIGVKTEKKCRIAKRSTGNNQKEKLCGITPKVGPAKKHGERPGKTGKRQEETPWACHFLCVPGNC